MLLLASEFRKGAEDLTTNSYIFFASLNTLMWGGKHTFRCCLGDSYLHGWPLSITFTFHLIETAVINRLLYKRRLLACDKLHRLSIVCSMIWLISFCSLFRGWHWSLFPLQSHLTPTKNIPVLFQSQNPEPSRRGALPTQVAATSHKRRRRVNRE